MKFGKYGHPFNWAPFLSWSLNKTAAGMPYLTVRGISNEQQKSKTYQHAITAPGPAIYPAYGVPVITKVKHITETRVKPNGLHPAWLAFIRHCQELGFGEISQLKIQNGVPVFAEETTRKIKFS